MRYFFKRIQLKFKSRKFQHESQRFVDIKLKLNSVKEKQSKFVNSPANYDNS